MSARIGLLVMLWLVAATAFALWLRRRDRDRRLVAAVSEMGRAAASASADLSELSAAMYAVAQAFGRFHHEVHA